MLVDFACNLSGGQEGFKQVGSTPLPYNKGSGFIAPNFGYLYKH